MFLLAAATAFAGKVTFRVDMSGQTVSGSGVHIAGSFQSQLGGNDWNPGSTALTDKGSGIWELEVTLAPGTYEYKFVNGTQWGSDENPGVACRINGNRAFTCDAADLVLPTVPFGGCESGKVSVRFQVNMKGQGFLNPNGVHVAGSFQGQLGGQDWQPGATRLYQNGDSIFRRVVSLTAGSYQYKFINGNSWGDDESVPTECNTGGNRTFSAGSTDAVDLIAVEFGKCPPGVTFSVDMSDETISGSGVFIAGSFNGWDATKNKMEDPDNDKVFTITLQLAPGTYEYKFVNGSNFENVPGQCAVNGNRQVVVTSGQSVPAVKFGKCRPRLTLRVDMSLETIDANGVHVAGAFQGWNPSGTPMTDIGNGIWEATVEVDAGSYEYKFVNGNAWGKDESVPGACASNNNRRVVVGTTDTTLAKVCFKQCTENCVANPNPAVITFRVDMSKETIESSGVWLMGGMTNPTWQQGAVQMTDADNDKIFEATVNVSGPAEFQYKYSNGDPKIAQFQDGESYDFKTGGCGTDNGIGGFNRTFTRSGNAESVPTYFYNSCDLATSLVEVRLNNGFKLFPNPANGELFIMLNADVFKGANVKLMDITGAEVLNTNFANDGTHALDISRLKGGMYLVYVTDSATGLSGVQKLLVK